MPVYHRLIGVFAASLLLSACGEATKPAPQAKTERGTSMAPVSHGATTLPKGVTVDDDGRWSLAEAPPSPDGAADQIGLAPPEGALFIFYHRPPTAEESGADSLGVNDEPMLPIYRGRLIVERGCIRLDIPSRPAVRFSTAMRAAIDKEGYLVVRPVIDHPSASPAFPRIGEPVQWDNGPVFKADPNEPKRVTDPKATAPIIAACGAGPVVKVPFSLKSNAEVLRQDRAAAARVWRDSYGLSDAEIQARIRGCTGTDCYPTHPRPVANKADCPPGSEWQSMMCRTPEGYIRPIPPVVR